MVTTKRIGVYAWPESTDIGAVIRNAYNEDDITFNTDAIFAAILADGETLNAIAKKSRIVQSMNEAGEVSYTMLPATSLAYQGIIRKMLSDKSKLAIPAIGVAAIHQSFGNGAVAIVDGKLKIYNDVISTDAPKLDENGTGENYQISSLDDRINRAISEINLKFPGADNKRNRAKTYHRFTAAYMDVEDSGTLATEIPEIDTERKNPLKVYVELDSAKYRALDAGINTILTRIGVRE